MKIVVVSPEPYHRSTGGVSAFLCEILPRISQSFQLQLLAIGPEKSLRRERINSNFEIFHFPHFNLPVGTSFPPNFIPKVTKKLIAEADLVFVQTVACLVPLFFTWKYGKPLVMYFHGFDWEIFPRAIGIPWLKKPITPFVKSYARFWYNRCQLLITPSVELQEKLKKNGIRVPQKSIPCGIDTQRFLPPVDKGTAKRKIGISENEMIIGYTGRLSHEKNLDLLIEQFEILQTHHSNLTLLLVGDGVNYDRSKIKQNPKIISPGQKIDVVPYLQAMDFFFLPSETETSSLSCMEAMACGLPVIAHRVGLLGEYIFSGQNGYLVEVGRREESLAFSEQLITNTPHREQMGTMARQTMEQRFNWDQSAEMMTACFKEMLGRRAA